MGEYEKFVDKIIKKLCLKYPDFFWKKETGSYDDILIKGNIVCNGEPYEIVHCISRLEFKQTKFLDLFEDSIYRRIDKFIESI